MILRRTLRICTTSVCRFSTAVRRLKDERNKKCPEGLLPSWESGSGHYGKTWGTVMSQTSATMDDLLVKYVDTTPVQSKGAVFTIGDYGTNDGAVSMPLLTKIIRRLREKHGEGLAIQVVYEDQEKNDYNSLFNRLADKSCYMSEFSNVYALATSTNFYKQCVPDSTMDIIFCGNAIHWLRDPSCVFQDSITQLSPHVTEEEFRHFQEEAASQLERFLLLRARELKTGGILAVMGGSLPENFRELLRSPDVISGKGDAINKCGIAGFRMALDLDAAWRQMKQQGFISEEEYKDVFLPMAMRTAREVTQPFEEVTSPVRQADLDLEHFDQVQIPDPVNCVIQPGKQADSTNIREYFADRMVVMTKTLFAGQLMSSLSDTRSEEEKRVIVEKYFDLFRQMVVRVDPDIYSSGYNTFFRLVARKI